MRICISSGHSTKCQGAIGILNEVEEATAVVDEVATCLHDMGYAVEKFHDTISDDQSENLRRITDWHNAQGSRDYDVSVHFNASDNHQGHGVEVWYYSEEQLAADISAAISQVSGLTDRGPKASSELYFLMNTSAPAVLLEICFCDHAGDAEKYRTYFPLICEAIATVLSGDEMAPGPEPEPPDSVLFQTRGKCSYFGGADDTTGVESDEGLAFHYAITEANQHLFVPFQPVGTSGLARRLNGKAVRYLACRWNYDVTSKEMLASDTKALVTATKTGISQTAFCADWGPNSATGRVADLSPALMQDLGIETDDEVIVIYPAPEE
jgi:N-acetylmuramoyl-L-alanine amidase